MAEGDETAGAKLLALLRLADRRSNGFPHERQAAIARHRPSQISSQPD